MAPSTDIDYDQAGRWLAASELSPTPGEAHGMLCGLICGGDRAAEESWLDELLPKAGTGDVLAGEARDGLSGLARQTWEQIRGPGLGFSLLLPAETEPLAARATALYDWVRGFLFALGVQGISERDLSEQTREVFRDFVALTRMDLDALEDAEENEEALTEVAEFVWVAAMLVYEERVAGPEEAR
jgi:hypothetical protein